jgi:hypothetical protein
VLWRRGLEREKADARDVMGAVVSELGMPRTLKESGGRGWVRWVR